MSCIAEQTFTKAFQTSTFSQNFDIKEPGLSRVSLRTASQSSFVEATTPHIPNQIKPVKLELLDSQSAQRLSVSASPPCLYAAQPASHVL